MTPPENEIYIPVYNELPPNWEDSRLSLVEILREVTNGVNDKDSGYYTDTDSLNGQQWIPGTGIALRSVYRKVISIGPLPDFAVTNPKTVAHGLIFDENACITRIYGTASNRSASTLTLGIPLPYVDPVTSSNIGVSIDNTNVIISGDGATDYTSYDCAYIVIEYLDEA